jgi:DNA-binding protein
MTEENKKAEEKITETKEQKKEISKEKDNSNYDDSVIFIGNKPFMSYVTGVVMQFTTKDIPEVVVRARGKFISRAVDIAEVVSKRFLENVVDIGDIKIDSEEFQNKEGKTVRVSTIDISLNKK